MDTLEIFIYALFFGLPLLTIYLILCVYLLSINKVKLFWFVNFIFFVGLFLFLHEEVVSSSHFMGIFTIKEYIANTILAATPLTLLSGMLLYGSHHLKNRWYVLILAGAIFGVTILFGFAAFAFLVVCAFTGNCSQ